MKENGTKPTLRWGKLATADVDSILDYISDHAPSAPSKVIKTIEDRVSSLRSYPQMGRLGRVEGTRELVIPKSYVVVYKEDPEEVVILRVLHTKQQWPA